MVLFGTSERLVGVMIFTRQRPYVRENKKLSNYDVWKLQTPEEYYSLSDECDECGCSTAEVKQLGDIWVCVNCYEELNENEESS